MPVPRRIRSAETTSRTEFSDGSQCLRTFPLYRTLIIILYSSYSFIELLTEEQQETVDAAAEMLYGLIHARYILTGKGLQAMYNKFNDIAFGRCNRVYCEMQPLLPVGTSDQPRKSTVNLYCPRCNDIYYPKSSRHSSIDGAYFGTTFPHLFFMTYPSAIPPPPTNVYTPRIFGFKIRRNIENIEDISITNNGAAAVNKQTLSSSLSSNNQPQIIHNNTATTSTVAPSSSSSNIGIPAQTSITPEGTVNVIRTVGPSGISPNNENSTVTKTQNRNSRKELTTVLPRDANGRPIGRDGRTLMGGDDFFDEEDAEEDQDHDAPNTNELVQETMVASGYSEFRHREQIEEKHNGPSDDITNGMRRMKV